MGPDENVAQTFPDNPFQNNGVLEDDRRFMDGPKVKLPELMSFVRHSKMSLLKEALDYLPNKKFDKTLVKVHYYYCLSSILMIFMIVYDVCYLLGSIC